MTRSRRIRPWLAALVAVVLAVSACGTGDEASSADAPAADTTTAPDSTGNDTVTTDAPTDATTGDTTSADGSALFDPTVVHEISVTFDQADYEAILDAYTETGDKEWMEATVTVDGTTYESAGIRLKGNSSLMGLRGQGSEDGGAASPETLPWLIRLDRFVDGQTHQGYTDIVVRSNNTETSLNEALALALLAEAGLASQDAAPAGVSMNGSDPVLRLVVEHPDDDAWQDTRFDADGALYKAESTGDWSYRGDDPEEYTDVFDQEGGADLTDLTPLIELLDFINNSDDETFAAELDDHLDVDAFATYLAMMDLIGNSDDIDGPGNNSYVWWDADTGRFTVVPWDMNLAFGGFGRGPGGGFPGGDRGGFPGGSMPGGPPSGEQPDGFPGGAPPAGGFQDGDAPDGGFSGGGGPGGGFGGARSNPLVERFHADETFQALYEERLAELRADLFDSGVAEAVLDAWVDTLTTQATHLVDADTVTTEADAVRSVITS